MEEGFIEDRRYFLDCFIKKLSKMNKNNKAEKKFDTVKFFREVKEKIAKETKGMTFTEFKEYLNRRKFKLAR